MKPKAQTKEIRHLDQVVFMDERGNRHAANVTHVHSRELVDVLYQDNVHNHTATRVPHKSVDSSGPYFIHLGEEEK